MKSSTPSARTYYVSRDDKDTGPRDVMTRAGPFQNFKFTMQLKHRIDRFIRAQETNNLYQRALAEIRNGRKESHWIWFVFPQLRGLGKSSMCDYYGIRDIDEARELLGNRLLRMRLRMITYALLKHKDKDIETILGPIDSVKMCSCATLFYHASDNETDRNVFRSVLDAFYNGEEDLRTLTMLGLVRFTVNDKEI